MLPAALNYVAGGWHVSGIFTGLSGSPVYVTEGSQVWGGGQRSRVHSRGSVSGAFVLSPGLHSNVAGSGSIGTNGNPATGGTGLNLFANPQAAYNDFGYVQLSRDVDGYGHPLYGLPFWNLDSSLGKRVPITEHKFLRCHFRFLQSVQSREFQRGAGR